MARFGFLYLSAACLLCVLLDPHPCLGCTCLGRPTDPFQMVAGYDLVFSGRVFRIIDPRDQIKHEEGQLIRVSGGDPIRYCFVINRLWKGDAKDTVSVVSNRSGAACGYVFKLNENYLVFGNEWRGGIRTSSCTFTAPLAKASQRIASLNSLPVKGSPYEVDRAIVKALATQTLAPSESIRAAAASSLGFIRKMPDIAVPALEELYRSGMSKDRAAALYNVIAFYDTARAVTLLKQSFLDADPLVRTHALRGFDNVAKKQPKLWASECWAGLHDPSPEVRSMAILYMADKSFDRQACISYLIDALQHASSEVRVQAAAAMKHYPDCGEDGLAALSRAYRDPVPQVQLFALYSLLDLGNEAAIQAAFKLGMNDPDRGVRGDAIMRAQRYYKGRPELARIFVGSLKDPDHHIRHESMARLSTALPLELTPSERSDLIAAVVSNARDKEGCTLFYNALSVLSRLDAVVENQEVFLAGAKSSFPVVRNHARRQLEANGLKAPPEQN